MTSLLIVALRGGVGDWVVGGCVLVCESGVSTPPRRIQARDKGGGGGWNQAYGL